MAIKVVNQSPNIPTLEGKVGANTTIVVGDLLYSDTANGVLKPATNSAGTVLDIEGIAAQAVTTGAGGSATVKYIPIVSGQFVVADCNANTASNQLHKNHAMTDAGTVNNTANTVATTLGVFRALGQVGAATDKKLFGYFIKIGQVTA